MPFRWDSSRSLAMMDTKTDCSDNRMYMAIQMVAHSHQQFRIGTRQGNSLLLIVSRVS